MSFRHRNQHAKPNAGNNAQQKDERPMDIEDLVDMGADGAAAA